MDEALRYIRKVILLVLLSPFRILPIKRNRVMIHNDLGRKISGNPKCIAEYLAFAYQGKFDIITTFQSRSIDTVFKHEEITTVSFNSLLYFYYAMTSKVFITNSGGFSYLPLRKSQYVINTWHGGGAYKKSGIYAYGNNFLFRKDLLLSARKTSVFLSSCSRFTEALSESLLVPKSIFWNIGMPRNDKLLNPDKNERRRIREQIGLADDECLVLFAPTYRKINDNYYKNSVAIDYGIDPERVCNALTERFGGKWHFAFRLHPNAINRDNVPKGNVLNLSEYEDMQDLLIAADVMINDFSSSMWDFMLTGKPGFMFAVDLQHYIDTTDVYTPVDEWPFTRATNNNELEYNILNFDERKYWNACRKHYENLGGCETGRATKLVCERIYDVCFQKMLHT